MTNDVAIKRKLIYQGITLAFWLGLTIFVCGMSLNIHDMLYWQCFALPILILICLNKIIKTIAFVHGTYNSDVEFKKYRDVAKNLPKTHKIIYKYTRAVAMLIGTVILFWCCYSTFTHKSTICDDFKDIKIENFVDAKIDFPEKTPTPECRWIMPAETCYDSVWWVINEKSPNDPYQRITVKVYYEVMKDCPLLSVALMYADSVDSVKSSSTQTTHRIDKNGVKGWYCLYEDSDFMEITVKKGNDYFFARVSSTDPDLAMINAEKVVDFAVKSIENY